MAKSQIRVAAFEDVTVPAGTFKAFRIEYKGGIGSSTSGGRREQSLSGIESNDTYWYAPGVKIVVKSIIERLGSHYRGVGRTITELLALPGKGIATISDIWTLLRDRLMSRDKETI